MVSCKSLTDLLYLELSHLDVWRLTGGPSHSDIIVSIVRITQVVHVNLSDVTYADYPAQIWTVVEVSVAIIIACLPVCRTVIERFLRLSLRLFSHSDKYQQTEESALQGVLHYEEPVQGLNIPTRAHGQVPDPYRRLEEQADAIPLSPIRHSLQTSHNLDNRFSL